MNSARQIGVYRPLRGKLFRQGVLRHDASRSIAVEAELKNWIENAEADSVSKTAWQSYHRDDYEVGLYGKFGEFNVQMRADLASFTQKLRWSKSPYHSFWAVFSDETPFNEIEFLQKFAHETQGLIEGPGVEVIGLHANSFVDSRRFRWPAILFTWTVASRETTSAMTRAPLDILSQAAPQALRWSERL